MKKASLFFLIAALFISTSALGQTAEKTLGRPSTWAEQVEKSGLPNLHRVSEHLWRGAQPRAEGFKELEKLGIKTVVNLRHDTDHDDRPLMEEAGVWGKIDYVRIRFNPFRPRKKQVVEFLKIVADPARRPVFVHCKHGADRTGMMVALYRLVFENWTKEEALREMTEGGFGFHSIWQNMIKFIKLVDVEELKEAVLPSGPVRQLPSRTLDSSSHQGEAISPLRPAWAG
jgi:protein tyrosine/serine phosphatase